ncbi:hypothetical protein ACP1PL_004349, partial [Yersinia enterocolitica]
THGFVPLAPTYITSLNFFFAHQCVSKPLNVLRANPNFSAKLQGIDRFVIRIAVRALYLVLQSSRRLRTIVVNCAVILRRKGSIQLKYLATFPFCLSWSTYE